MQDNLSEKLANAAKKILDHCDADAHVGQELKNVEGLIAVVSRAEAHSSVIAHFGDPRVSLHVTSEEGDTSIAQDGSVFQSVRLSVDVILPSARLNHVECLTHLNLLHSVVALATEVEQALEGLTWVLKMTAEKAMVKRMKDRREANETLASAILHTPEAKEALKHIRLGETRVFKHPGARLLERCELTWNVQTPSGRVYIVRGMTTDEESVRVTRDA